MCFKRRPDISIIVPFKDHNEHRTRVWEWLKRYYAEALPDAEIVVGTDDVVPFSKSCAVNRAANKARGRIFVVIDADALVQPEKLREVCDELILDRRLGRRTWAMVYERIYYLNEKTTLDLLKIPPELLAEIDYEWPSPPPENWREGNNNPLYGHPFGAMCMVMPREAFFHVRGFCESFRAWGSEDASMTFALDTLWGLHKVHLNDILHLWHIRPGRTAATRKWVGQPDYGPANSRLGHQFSLANGYPSWMRALVDEHAGLGAGG